MDAKRILVDNMARIFKATTRDKEIEILCRCFSRLGRNCKDGELADRCVNFLADVWLEHPSHRERLGQTVATFGKSFGP